MIKKKKKKWCLTNFLRHATRPGSNQNITSTSNYPGTWGPGTRKHTSFAPSAQFGVDASGLAKGKPPHSDLSNAGPGIAGFRSSAVRGIAYGNKVPTVRTNERSALSFGASMLNTGGGAVANNFMGSASNLRGSTVRKLT